MYSAAYIFCGQHVFSVFVFVYIFHFSGTTNYCTRRTGPNRTKMRCQVHLGLAVGSTFFKRLNPLAQLTVTEKIARMTYSYSLLSELWV